MRPHFLTVVLSAVSISAAAAQSPPLDVDMVLQTRHLIERGPVAVAFDGETVAATVMQGVNKYPRQGWYTVAGQSVSEGEGRTFVSVTDRSSGKSIALTAGDASSWGATWAPTDARLAYSADTGGRVGLWIWDRTTRASRQIPGVIPRSFFAFEVPRWTADGRSVLLKTTPMGMSVSEANALAPVQQNVGRPFRDMPDGARLAIYEGVGSGKVAPDLTVLNRYRGDLTLIDTTSGEKRVVVRDTKALWYDFSPDGKSLAYASVSGVEPGTQQLLFDVHVVELASGLDRPIATALRLEYADTISWSPNARLIAIVTAGQKADHELSLFSLDDAKPVVRTQNLKAIAARPLWSADGRYLFVVNSLQEIVQVDAGEGSSRLVARLEGADRVFLVPSQRDNLPYQFLGMSLFAISEQPEAGTISISEIGLARSSYKVLARQPGTIPSRNYLIRGTNAGLLIGSSSATAPTSLSFFMPKKRSLTPLVPDSGGPMPATRKLLDWVDAAGSKHSAMMLLPQGYKGGRVPTVVYVYGGDKGNRYWQVPGMSVQADLNMELLASRGYAVLYADTPIGAGDPAKQIFDGVDASVDAAVRAGIADPTRLAIFGHSYGGYSSLAVITRTKRFKAAIISSPTPGADLISDYLHMAADGSALSIGYVEQGQGRMEQSLWANREKYIRNSPLFELDKVSTPILISLGIDDNRIEQTDMLFVALRRLDQDVTYLVYDRDGHGTSNPENVRDLWKRRFQFLEEKLR